MKEALIVIASFADGYLDDLLKSIKENTTDVDYDIQVVDNHRDQEKIKTLVVDVCNKHNVPLHLDTNITGYGDALNTCVEVSDSDSKYILYMDSDTLVTKGWLREMIDCYERNEANGCRMVGPLVKNFDDKYLPGVYEHYGNPDDLEGNDVEIKKGYLIGVCLLRKREDLDVFKWDKNFIRAYWEDNDITEQVRFYNGKTYLAGKACMKHFVNSSHATIKAEGQNPSQVGAANRAYYLQKWNIVENSLNKTPEEIRKMTLGIAFTRTDR